MLISWRVIEAEHGGPPCKKEMFRTFGVPHHFQLPAIRCLGDVYPLVNQHGAMGKITMVFLVNTM